MRSIVRRGILVPTALVTVAAVAPIAGCSDSGGPEGYLAEGNAAAQRPTLEVVARLPRPSVRPGALVPVARFEGSYDPETGQLSFQPLDLPGRGPRAPSFGPTPKSGMVISTINAVNSTSSTTGVTYTGEGGALRTCRLPSANICQAATGGPANQPCTQATCASLKLNDILGLNWSEVWVQIDPLSTGTVMTGDNRALLTPTDWRVTLGGMKGAATSPGAYRFGAFAKTTTPGAPGPDSAESDWQFNLGPGATSFTFQVTAYGASAPVGYTMSATTSCSPVPVPSTGTVNIFTTTNQGSRAVSVTGGLPFPFTFYSVTDTALWASLDGAYGLGSSTFVSSGTYGALPVAATAQGLILPQWAHTQGRTAPPAVRVVGFPSPAAAPISYVIDATGIRWTDIQGALLDYQVVINSDGSVRFLYPGGTNTSGTADHGSRSLLGSTTSAANVLLGAPFSASPDLGATIGLQGALVGSVTPFTQYGSGGTVTGTGAGVAQQCAPGPGCTPTLLPGALMGTGSCFAIDFVPAY